jgi:hypothetical protein
MPDAIETLIAQLQANKGAPDGKSEPVKVPYDDFIAALNEIETAIGGGGPFLPLDGGTMTGTEVFADGGSWGTGGLTTSSPGSVGSLNVSGTNVPTTGLNDNGGLNLIAGSAIRATVTPAGVVQSVTSTGWALKAGAASATAPTLVPDLASPLTGIGAATAGDISEIVAGTEIGRWISSGVQLGTGIGTSAALGDYESGTWTPVDASGAGLTFTDVVATYQVVGGTAFVCCTVNFPVTASSAGVAIGGLPKTIENVVGVGGAVFAFTSIAAIGAVIPTANTTQITLLTSTGPVITNAQMSDSGLRFQFSYPIS